MAIWDKINIFNRFRNRNENRYKSRRTITQYAKTVINPLTNIDPAPEFGGARTSIPKFTQGGGGYAGMALPKKTQRDLGLDETSFASLSIPDLLDRLTDAHPDLSYALWNFMRMSNSGYTISVSKVGKPDISFPQGEEDIKAMFENWAVPNAERFEKSRSIDRVINQLIQSIVVRGAAALEVVLTKDKKDVAFLAPVDPSTIEFKFENDRYVPYQDQGKVSLDLPTFFYEGLDERIDDPYGRSPILSAINIIMFQLQILNDIKAVVHNQGYPRLDIKILEEVLLQRMPIQIRNNEEKKQEWLTAKLNEIIQMYSQLSPDDAFVHFDSLEIGMAGGSSHGGALFDPSKLMQAIDNLIMSGLKTLSTILGRRSTGNTESFAKIEIKLYLKGVEAIQEVVESILSRALTLCLNIRGKQGIVHFKFKPLEIRTELEQAQFEQIALMNYAYMRDQGWIDQEEAAMRAVGHAPVKPEPDWEHLRQPRNKDGGTPKGTPDTKNNTMSNLSYWEED